MIVMKKISGIRIGYLIKAKMIRQRDQEKYRFHLYDVLYGKDGLSIGCVYIVGIDFCCNDM
jgi:hypothetical protein